MKIKSDEDLMDDDNPIPMQSVVEQFLTFDVANLSDWIEETEVLSNQVHKILFDVEDDKLGRIKDLYDAKITEVAKWVEQNHDTNGFAKHLLTESIKDTRYA